MNNAHPRGGRGRGEPRRGVGAPRFNEFKYTYRGAKHRRGQGLGFQSPYDNSDTDARAPRQASLLRSYLTDRPLLKPVTFVRAGTLFQDEDEIFKATTADNGMSLKRRHIISSNTYTSPQRMTTCLPRTK